MESAVLSVIWLATESTFWMTPWGNMIRIPAATMGIHPNGTSLEAGSALLDSSILGMSVGIGILYFVVLMFLSTFVFQKRVMK